MSVEQVPEPVKAGRPKAAEAEARLNDLLDTAARLILEKGYGKVSLEAIAKEARVAVRTIYVKFGGKAGLLKAILLRYRAGAFDPAGMETLHRPIRDTLREFGLRFHRLVSTPEATALYQIVVAEAHANPTWRKPSGMPARARRASCWRAISPAPILLPNSIRIRRPSAWRST